MLAIMTRKKLIAVSALGALFAGSVFAGTVTVVVNRARVRKKPNHLSKTLGRVKLGERLKSHGERRGWYQIDFRGQDGYIQKRAVVTKKVRLGRSRSVGSTGTSAEEITLAGKGFNKQVEGEYKKKVGPEAFVLVDEMETKQASPRSLRKFMRSGKLTGGGS